MFISAENVSKRFIRRGKDSADEAAALDDVSLSVDRGHMLALVGHSGSGKTTFLRCLAGLETPDRGSITIDGTVVFTTETGPRVPAEHRNIGFIFQSYALWPNMTVARNVEYPLKRRKVSPAVRRQKVGEYLDLVGCADLRGRYPHQISGGQQQRVALARALVYEPSVVLFDEPLSNLDAALRERLRYQIREIQKTIGFTGIYVTHDLSEAFFVADRIAIMAAGRILQLQTPAEVYKRPVSPLVAGLVGSRNELRGKVAASGGSLVFAASEQLSIPLEIAEVTADARNGEPAVLLARPEGVRVVPVADGFCAVQVIDRVNLGGHIEYLVELPGGTRWRAVADRMSEPIEIGGTVGITVVPEDLHVFAGPGPEGAGPASAAGAGS